MSSGGPRPNQTGRPKGSKTQPITVKPSTREELTSKLQERIKKINITPLEVMLLDMKLHHDTSRKLLVQHEAIEEEGETKAEVFQKAVLHSSLAVESASKVAPYIHAKLQAVTLKGDKEAPLELNLLDSAALKAAVRGNK